MKLEEFIHQSLTQIVNGILKTQESLSETSALINPPIESSTSSSPRIKDKKTNGINFLQNVDFDVALTVSEGSQDKIGGGIKIAALGIGGETKSDASNTTVSRIKFTVPIALPVQGEKIERSSRGTVIKI